MTTTGSVQRSRTGTLVAVCDGLLRLWGPRIRQRVICAIERRRMHQIRQNPAPLLSALQHAKCILIVCHGNIIRSPFAASMIRNALGDNAPVAIASAGLEARPGDASHPTGLQTAVAHNVDLSHHAASPVDSRRIGSSDVVLVMDIPQLVALRQRFPKARSKTFLLACLAPDTPLEIRDPVNGDEAVFRACFDHISKAVRPLVRTLSRNTA